jgi:hypothetical protein
MRPISLLAGQALLSFFVVEFEHNLAFATAVFQTVLLLADRGAPRQNSIRREIE